MKNVFFKTALCVAMSVALIACGDDNDKSLDKAKVTISDSASQVTANFKAGDILATVKKPTDSSELAVSSEGDLVELSGSNLVLTEAGAKLLNKNTTKSLNYIVTAKDGDDTSENMVTMDVPEVTADLELQLLHFADMDSSDVVAMKNVENMSALVNAYRTEMPNNTLVLSSGDNFIPGPRVAAADDDSFESVAEVGTPGRARADIAFLNSMGIQASVVGNHDLDESPDGLKDAIAKDDKFLGANFPYLAANIDFSTDDDIKGQIQADGQDLSALPAGSVTGYGTLIVDGEKVGIIGAATPTLPQITNVGGMTIKPSTDDLNALVTELQGSVDKLIAETGVNKVIMLAHMQTISTEMALASKLKGVDIIVAGGSNSLFSDSTDALWEGDSNENPYPYIETSASDEPVLVVNTDGDYKYLGRLVVGFDEDGKIITRTLDEATNGAYATTDANVTTAKGTAIAGVTNINTALQNTLKKLDGDIYGKSSVFLNGQRSGVRAEETNLGNLTADANLWYARLFDPKVQISIKNGGGIRDVIGSAIVPPGSTTGELVYSPTAANPDAGKEEGDISQLDITNSLRFNNRLWVYDITGEELYNVMEHAVARVEDRKGQFPQIAGFKLSFDPTKNARVQVVDENAGTVTVTQIGERIRNLALVDDDGKVTDIIVKDGVLQPAMKDKNIRIVTLNFMAGAYAGDNPIVGGDGYPWSFPWKNLMKLPKQDSEPGDNKSDFSSHGREQDALAEYLAKFYSTTPYAKADTTTADDMRIQNLSAREDTVLK